MDTTKLTVRLPKKDLDRYLRVLQAEPNSKIHPGVERISGLAPSEVNAREVYREHLLEKHSHP